MPAGPKVVIDHIEQHGEPFAVGGVDQPLQALWAAIGVVRRVQVDAVIAPAPASRKLGDGHELDMGDAELDQMIEALNRGLERPRRGEGADVQLVEHGGGQRPCLPAGVGPGKRRVIEHPRGAMHAMRLPG